VASGSGGAAKSTLAGRMAVNSASAFANAFLVFRHQLSDLMFDRER
jgi:anion-transporting  ArsA/GET3 family ATPase